MPQKYGILVDNRSLPHNLKSFATASTNQIASCEAAVVRTQEKSSPGIYFRSIYLKSDISECQRMQCHHGKRPVRHL